MTDLKSELLPLDDLISLDSPLSPSYDPPPPLPPSNPPPHLPHHLNTHTLTLKHISMKARPAPLPLTMMSKRGRIMMDMLKINNRMTINPMKRGLWIHPIFVTQFKQCLYTMHQNPRVSHTLKGSQVMSRVSVAECGLITTKQNTTYRNKKITEDDVETIKSIVSSEGGLTMQLDILWKFEEEVAKKKNIGDILNKID
ncbi:hypothetical protein LXL04_007390 [Taraxacum kok-saghyz]